MLLIKIGGGKQIDLESIVSDLASIAEPIVIIHGANALRDSLAEQIGFEKEIITSVSGFTSVRSTDQLIDLMLMSYAGLRNKRLVSLMQQHGLNAIGLTGADGCLIQGKRNVGIRARQNGKRVLIRDNSGKPKEINVELLELLLDAGYLPVITVPIIDEQSKLINTENDDIVALLSQELEFREIIMLIEEGGLLKDPTDPDSVIAQVNHQDLDGLLDRVTGRMKRKLYAISKMLRQNGALIRIADGRSDKPVSRALDGWGTTIRW